ncbi:MAG: hypothetical protein EBZ48_05080 [Proteobacteria bacterium]|nr:hypothetical protein [Pseudomonadota bacterium]
MTDTALVPLASLADSLVRRGLAVPAVFFLELHKPMSTVLSFGVQAVDPVLRLILGQNTMQAVTHALESRERLEQLITLIEERS